MPKNRKRVGKLREVWRKSESIKKMELQDPKKEKMLADASKG